MALKYIKSNANLHSLYINSANLCKLCNILVCICRINELASVGKNPLGTPDLPSLYKNTPIAICCKEFSLFLVKISSQNTTQQPLLTHHEESRSYMQPGSRPNAKALLADHARTIFYEFKVNHFSSTKFGYILVRTVKITRGLPYMTSIKYWDFMTPSLSFSGKSILFVRKFGVFIDPLLGRHIWKPPWRYCHTPWLIAGSQAWSS